MLNQISGRGMESLQNRVAGRSWKITKASKVYYLIVMLLCMLPFAEPGRSTSGRSHTGWWGCENGLSKPTVNIKTQAQEKDFRSIDLVSVVLTAIPKRRFLLNGLGSTPPQCTSKCGSCKPCSPVHVPIQPGLVKTTEYYPEAWRCKCREKLYMP
ncbi:hypothetical protein O6H91_04G099700 [Diphasiastrum complanatum]|uniref:Uncharacterized protein n=1 Tax=Diphasiastrum complanatum TaxID=34168 RepID=A0ACC2E027_DIPCM|nr:hypothetical protein O6H91_Y528800 [Diphasiastrum complanatum]KAJ7559750.1 hypothetical protein O6H91_04G099700 [Diphasiastrum complanatum]